jgi:hypothetical protein
MRAIYKNWLRIMLTEKNPYTKIALKDDPALAILQLQNEDSLSSGHSIPCRRRKSASFGTQYGAWLKKKYGSLDGAQKFWGTGNKSSTQSVAATTVEGDDFLTGCCGNVSDSGNSRFLARYTCREDTSQSRSVAVFVHDNA